MNRSCYSRYVEKKEKQLLVRNRCGEMKKYDSELLWRQEREKLSLRRDSLHKLLNSCSLRLRSGITAQNVYF